MKLIRKEEERRKEKGGRELPNIFSLHSYPAVVVVPSETTDEDLAALACQFQHSRWPVVTWKHPKRDAVMLRSSSFVPSSITRKKFNAVSGKLLPSAITQKQQVSSLVSGLSLGMDTDLVSVLFAAGNQ